MGRFQLPEQSSHDSNGTNNQSSFKTSLINLWTEIYTEFASVTEGLDFMI